MNKNFFKFITKYIHLLPNNFFKLLQFDKNKFIRSDIFFDTVEYKSDYNGDNLANFFVPLSINISQISDDIQKIIKEKKVVSIISSIVLVEKETDVEYTHSLGETRELYSLDDFNKWPSGIMFNLVQKLELYNSFKKISIIIKVKPVTKVV